VSFAHRLIRKLGRALLPARLSRNLLALRSVADRASFRAYRQLESERTSVPSSLVELRVRALHGRPVRLRPGTSDVDVFWETFVGLYHLPPSELEPNLIWDLGANIGLTMAHFAVLYPSARIVGIELDGENARLCRTNVASWADRCEVIEAAFWPERGCVSFTILRGR
jgi:hypothetical protein